MRTHLDLAGLLLRLDGTPLKACRPIEGRWEFNGFSIDIGPIMTDGPRGGAELLVSLPLQVAGYPEETTAGPEVRAALAGLLHRRLSDACRAVPAASRRRWSGEPGSLEIEPPGPDAGQPGTVRIDGGAVRLRLKLVLPAPGRRLAGMEAKRLLTEALPALIGAGLLAEPVDLRQIGLPPTDPFGPTAGAGGAE